MGSHGRLKIIMPDETISLPAAEAQPVSQLDLRPLARVRRIPLIEREIREHLSRAALDVVFACAEVLSEGEVGKSQGRPQFFGSTMLTIDVTRLADVLREPADEGTARRLAALLAKDPSLDSRVEAIVRREVERLSRAQVLTVHSEARLRTQGTRVFLDLDVEASLR
jgi:hypothetical protein